MLSNLSLRRGHRPTWQSRSTRTDHRKATGENVAGCRRFPRRFAPRNDKPGSIARSAKPLYNLPACKALTTRKGHAASVRRQSRQRLRSERRYRRNWLVRFYRYLVRTGSAFPRLPRAQSALAMTHQAVPRCTSALARLNYPVQGAQGAPLQSDLQVGAVDGAL